MTADTTPPSAPYDPATGRWVLFATIAASSMAFISGSALNVALPALQADLGATGADLLWIINSYALLLGALLLVGGALGDRYGRKRVYGIGIVAFVTASLLCGLAPDAGLLIAARALQGIGGALMVPGSLAIVSAYFDDDRRGGAIGTWAAFTTLTSVLGPVLGGFLAENGLWRGVFFINLPLGVLALWALRRYVPESRDEHAPKRIDLPGALLATLGLAGFTYGFIEWGRQGAAGGSDPVALGSILGGVAALAAFVVVEARVPNPMMPLRLFRSRTFTGANLLTLLLYGAMGGALFFLPLNLIQVQGYGETVAGLATLPGSLLLIALSGWAGGLVDRVGPRPPLIIGPLIAGLGFLLYSFVGITGGPDDYWTTFLPPAIIFGFGLGITVAPLTTAVMGAVPQHNAGIASGINNAMSRSSQAFAGAVLGGVALLAFSGALLATPTVAALSVDAQAALAAEAVNFGAAAVPAGLDAATTAAVAASIDTAFVGAFQLVMRIAAGMAWGAAALAALFVTRELRAGPP